MRLPLIEGAYTARSVIADAQRAVNLYPEKNPKDSLVPFTHYNAPGLTALNTPPTANPGRGLYWANNDALYGVIGNTLYAIGGPPSWTFTALGSTTFGAPIVSMADNGTTLVLVDGTPNGYQVDSFASQLDGSATTFNFPTLAPTGGKPGLYVGYCAPAQTGTGGGTAGYTYKVTQAGYANIICYNAAIGASTTPNGTQTPAGTAQCIGVLFK